MLCWILTENNSTSARICALVSMFFYICTVFFILYQNKIWEVDVWRAIIDLFMHDLQGCHCCTQLLVANMQENKFFLLSKQHLVRMNSSWALCSPIGQNVFVITVFSSPSNSVYKNQPEHLLFPSKYRMWEGDKSPATSGSSEPSRIDVFLK